MRQSWTIEDLREIDDEDWRRYEIVDGALAVSPSATGGHELVSALLRRRIQAALPEHLEAVGPMGVAIGRSFRIPDLVVAARDTLRQAGDRLFPADVLLAVEVVSPGSVTTDRVTKPAQYAVAGIGAYWRVETDPISLSAYVLPRGATVYAELGSWSRGSIARVTEPFRVDVDVDYLAR